MLTKTVRQGLLLDFYGPLLTEQQREVLGSYFEDDLSLGEIAETRGVSRAAVHDLVKRGLAALESYEARLGLVARHERDRRSLQRLLGEVEEALAAEPEPATGAGGRSRAALLMVKAFLSEALSCGEWPLS
ncbi:MAG: YlxM family DNA-binding protein [Chitinophagales bacterium]